MIWSRCDLCALNLTLGPIPFTFARQASVYWKWSATSSWRHVPQPFSQPRILNTFPLSLFLLHTSLLPLHFFFLKSVEHEIQRQRETVCSLWICAFCTLTRFGRAPVREWARASTPAEEGTFLWRMISCCACCTNRQILHHAMTSNRNNAIDQNSNRYMTNIYTSHTK